jgi:ribose transport system substrate-binding protein
MKKFIRILLLPLLLFCLFGCGGSKTIKVCACIKAVAFDSEFWEVVKTGMRAGAEEFGIELEIVGPWAESDIDGQISILNTILNTDPPDVFILAATDYKRLVPIVERAAELRIPIVSMDSGVDSPIPVCFVASNNVEAGIKAGNEMKRILGAGPAKLAIVNHVPEATTAIEREEGVRRALADSPHIITGTSFTNNFEENAYTISLGLLETYPDLAGILAMNEVSTIGVARALKDWAANNSERPGRKVRLVGFDSSLTEVKLIEEGIIDATVIQKPFNMGYLAVRAALDAVKKKPGKAFIDTGSVLITAENLYESENQKLLFPFME